MNDYRYRLILYIIVTVILATIGIQVYWNYKNYLAGKQQLINDVQISLDKAVDDYYANLAEKTTLGFAINDEGNKHLFDKNSTFNKIIKNLDSTKKTFASIDKLEFKSDDGITVFKGLKADSLVNEVNKKSLKSKTTYLESNKDEDSVESSKFKFLTSKIIISISNDTLVLGNLDSLFRSELLRKQIDITYGISFKKDEDSTKYFDTSKIIKTTKSGSNNKLLKATSKSTFLPKKSQLAVYFTNETKVILKRIYAGFLISLLLILAVISCLFYLLNVIKHQKQLAEVKNDLISNITHEFKTPIATIGVAIESIKDFDAINDKTKTKKYLDISNQQLSKLNIMVEKILETATLDSNELNLTKEKLNINTIINNIVEKHKMQTSKQINFKASQDAVFATVDEFHFENTINNILDNAIKYGGELITINLFQNQGTCTMSVSDNGTTLTKAHKEHIFEKFYRIPKGNMHDVKGFGIGLYYAKKIIEKHGGNIQLELTKNATTFKITLPNE